MLNYNIKKSNSKFRENIGNTNELLLQTLTYCYALLKKKKDTKKKDKVRCLINIQKYNQPHYYWRKYEINNNKM